MKRRDCGTAAFVVLASLLAALPAWSEQEYLYSPKAVTPAEQTRAKDDVLVREVPVQQGDTLSGISRKFSGKGSYYPQILLFNDIKNPNLIYAGDTIKVPLPKDANPVASEATAAEPMKKPAPHKKNGKGKKAKHAAAHKAPAAAVPTAKRATATKAPAAEKAAAPTSPMELSISDLKKLEGTAEKPQAKRKKAATAVRVSPAKAQPKAKQPANEAPSAQGESVRTAPATAGESSSQKLYNQALKAYRQEDYRTALNLFDRYLNDYGSSSLAADASLYKAECFMKLAGQ